MKEEGLKAALQLAQGQRYLIEESLGTGDNQISFPNELWLCHKKDLGRKLILARDTFGF